MVELGSRLESSKSKSWSLITASFNPLNKYLLKVYFFSLSNS